MTVKKLLKIMKKFDKDAEVRIESLTAFGYHSAHKGAKLKAAYHRDKSGKYISLRQV